MTFAFTDKISLSNNVLVEELADESVLLNLGSSDYISQDDVGTRMFNVLTKSESIEDAYNTLVQEYEIEPEVLKQDLINYIEQLVKHGLVQVQRPE